MLIADLVAIGLRTLSSAAALLAAGLPIFIVLVGQLLDRAAHAIRSTGLRTVIIAAALTVLHVLVEPVRLVGAWSGLYDWSLHLLLLESEFGAAIGFRVLGLAIIAVSLLKADRTGDGFAMIGAILIAAAFALTGHTAADPQRWLLAPVLFLHLLAVAFWFGSLWPLVIATKFESAAVAGAVVGRFSGFALCVVPLILLAGVAMSALLLPGLSSLRSPYGILLLTKVGGFAILMALAALNKWRLTPGISKGNPSFVRAFRSSVTAEWILIFAVITVTTVMTALFSPDH